MHALRLGEQGCKHNTACRRVQARQPYWHDITFACVRGSIGRTGLSTQCVFSFCFFIFGMDPADSPTKTQPSDDENYNLLCQAHEQFNK